MEKIIKQVKSLNANDLKKKLRENGLSSGPITPTTKPRFQSQLAEKLFNTGKKNRPTEPVISKNNNNNSHSSYFSLCLPSNTDLTGGEEELVFSDKQDALKALKKFKGARLKSFTTKDAAISFSHLAADALCSSPLKLNNSTKDGGLSSVAVSGVSVESSPYHSVKTQDLVKLRKLLEQGDAKLLSDLVWSNPRYLISSGDTPTILQEGYRYNALHVVSKSNQSAMCQLILDILENPEFMYKLYSHSYETDETRANRINFIVDLYLNTPDKGNCETPLHFACKFGHANVVEVLVAHPKTDTSMKNRHGETPKDVICSRCSRPTAKQKAVIKELLEDHCYVPLIRSEDNVTQPVIGLPWSPDKANNPLAQKFNMKNWTPKDPVMTIKACAGPMSNSKAIQFHKKWAITPSGSLGERKKYCIMKKDSEKGLERIGREVAIEMGVPWAEYWPFLEAFADFSTIEGLDLFEQYLMKCQIALWLEKNLNPQNFKSHFTESLLQKSTHETAEQEEKILRNISFGNDTDNHLENLNGHSSTSVGEECGNEELDWSNSFSSECQKDVDLSQVITSPMSSLAACFSGMKLDDSLLDVSVDEVGDLFYLCSDTEEDLSKTSDDLPTNIDDLTLGKEVKKTANGFLIDLGSHVTGDDEANGYSTPPMAKEFPVLNLFIKPSCIPSDLEDCISDYRKMTSDFDDFKFLLILNLEESDKDDTMIHGDIVFIPAMNSVIQYKIFQDVSLGIPVDSNCDLNKSNLLKQDVCYNTFIVLKSDTNDADTVIEALATSTSSIDQALYIEGCFATKTDLNVYQAIEGKEIDCDAHPLICTWRDNLSCRVADKDFSWPSPTTIKKSKEIMTRSAPQLSVSHLSKTPAALYQSPALVRSHLRRAAENGAWSVDDLRIQLFTPNIPDIF